MTQFMKFLITIFLNILFYNHLHSQNIIRARDVGIPLDGITGKFNSITDVQGVLVGHETIIKGNGKLVIGKGPVRTGVTAILPRGKVFDPVFAGWYSLNGNGEMTGTTWVEESGFLEGPILITNTHSVGVVRDAIIEWQYNNKLFKTLYDIKDLFWSLPVVAETYDGSLNDINGFHVKKEHAIKALESAQGGIVLEGGVGGGTGMICHGFKGGIGTSSRKINLDGQDYTLGVLVQANYGKREDLSISGVPVGKEIQDLRPKIIYGEKRDGLGSIIVVVATDAPFLPNQLKRIVRRVPIGISRVGGYGSNGSGDIFISFSTANKKAFNRENEKSIIFLPNDKMNPFFIATVQATEEAILNALISSETMIGINDNVVYKLPHDRLKKVLKKYNRLNE
tara:strand:+ start:1347 stop:2531 length:1185 start_codon:yes stop_codon:yes gene_type:complete